MVAYFRGRRVVIAYDADLVGIKGALTNAQELLEVGARVRLLLWPPETIHHEAEDDQEGASVRKAALKLARELGLGDTMEAYIEALPAKHGHDLTDWVVKLGRDRSGLEALAKAGPLLQPAVAPDPAPETPPSDGERSPEDEAAFLRGCKAYSAIDDKTNFRSLLLVRAILERQRLITERNSMVTYRWNGAVWRPLVQAELERLIINALGVGAGRNKIAEASQMLKAETLLPVGQALDHRADLLCMSNGMADLENWAVIPHDPSYYATYQFPWPFDPQQPPPSCPDWRKALPEIVPDAGSRRELQQFFGYCMWRKYPWHKSLWLKGEGRNGKSVILHVLQRLVGEERTSSLNLKELERPFARASLLGRLLNVFEEASADFFSTDYFKILSSGGRVQAEFKYGQLFEFHCTSKLAFSMNNWPQFHDKSEGLYSRLLPIVLPRRFTDSDRDPFLKEKLEAELPGIFHWALAGLFDLRRQNGFIHCQATREVLAHYQRENDPLRSFVDDCCVVGLDEVENKDLLFEAYKSWCGKNAMGRPLPHNTFSRALKRTLGGNLNAEYRETPSGPRRYKGIRLRDMMEAAA
jgi:putative DNA primase/helicase